MELSNYKYINETYKLPYWFCFMDIDWPRYYATKNNKKIIEPTKKSIEKNILEDDKYIYSKEQYDIFEIFSNYLRYLEQFWCKTYCGIKYDITEDEMKKLLSIKICDYNWYFMWRSPEFDKNSNQLLFRKIADIDYTKYKYVAENHKLPEWIKVWYDGKKRGKQIIRPTKNSIKNNIVEDKKYIYSDELYDKYLILSKYLSYKHMDLPGPDYYPDEDITDDQIKQLLSIKISDYDWDYDFKDCRVFSGSNTLIFKKITDEDEYVDSDYNSD